MDFLATFVIISFITIFFLIFILEIYLYFSESEHLDENSYQKEQFNEFYKSIVDNESKNNKIILNKFGTNITNPFSNNRKQSDNESI